MNAAAETRDASSPAGSFGAGFAWAFSRDLALARRHPGETILVVSFFALVASLFPLGVGAEPQLLARIGPGIIWVCALLAAFLSLPGLFATDYADGMLEQMALCPHPMPAWIAGKIAAHWMSSGLPLTVLSPPRYGSPSTEMNFYFFASPATFFRLAGAMAPGFFALAAMSGVIGLYLGLAVAPTDAQQGEVYHVIFIHVPAAWMSMFIYFVMACYGAMTLAFNTRLAAMMARALAPTGAMFTFVALWTGAFWGRPTWGTYWVWDARLTSELVLFFLYFGFMALANAFEDPRRGDRAAALLALIGLVNLPIIYFSVLRWNTTQQAP